MKYGSMMSTLRWMKSGVRMCSMLLRVPVSRLSTQITRCPRRSSSSHRWDPRKPAPPGQRVGVEVLEQRLGELAGGAQLVAQLGQGEGAAVTLGQLDHAPADVRQHVGVIVEGWRDPNGAARLAQRPEVVRIELRVQRGLVAGLSQALLERERRGGERRWRRWACAGRGRSPGAARR